MTEQPKHFEDAIQRLEKIVIQMESGNESLENNITLYEEGMTLLSFCKEQLQSAEQKIDILSRDSKAQNTKDDDAD